MLRRIYNFFFSRHNSFMHLIYSDGIGAAVLVVVLLLLVTEPACHGNTLIRILK